LIAVWRKNYETKLLFTIAVIIALSIINFAQTPTEKRIIEVTGSAESLITPNEFGKTGYCLIKKAA
jgi:hypothetical protein